MSVKRKRYTGFTAISIVTDIGEEFSLLDVRVHVAEAEGTTANMVISSVSGIDPKHNLALNTTAMAAATDALYQPTRPLSFATGDEISVAWANANGKVWGVEIVYE